MKFRGGGVSLFAARLFKWSTYSENWYICLGTEKSSLKELLLKYPKAVVIVLVLKGSYTFFNSVLESHSKVVFDQGTGIKYI